MDPARPIQHKSQDLFGRLPFAEHLANSLCLKKDDASIVVGIEGIWGNGKTSCINLIKEILKEGTQRAIIVEYSPWLISTLDSLIEGLFVELAAALGTQSKAKAAGEAAQKVLKFGKMLTPIKLIPGVEPWGSLVEKVLSAVGGATDAVAGLADLSLQAQKEDLQKSLSRINRPIIVIIDDVDRLSPNHIRIVFQMLKAVVDFNRVSYLVVYDPEPVRCALSYEKFYDGKKYLEKLVQVSYSLPRLSYINMKDFVLSNIHQLVEEYAVDLSGVEGELYNALINKTEMIRILETPRDVLRLCNRLRISIPVTINEVSFSDLVAFETIELKFQELALIIRTEPNLFILYGENDYEVSGCDEHLLTEEVLADVGEDNGEPADEILQRINYEKRKEKGVKSLLLFLFSGLIKDSSFHGDKTPEYVNRIKNRDALLKLLHSGVTSFTYSSNEALRFCTTPEERKQIWKDHLDANDLFSWTKFLRDVAEKSEITDPVNLCNYFLEEIQGPGIEKSYHSLSRHFGEVLYNIIKSRPNETVIKDMLTSIVSSQKSLSVSESTLLNFLKDYGIWYGGHYEPDVGKAVTRAKRTVSDFIEYKDLYSAKDIWLNSIRLAASQDLIKTQKDVLSILYRWGQLNNNDYSEPQAYVMNSSADGEWLKRYLSLFQRDGDLRHILLFVPDESIDVFIERIKPLAGTDDRINNILDPLIEVLEAKKKESSLATK